LMLTVPPLVLVLLSPAAPEFEGPVMLLNN
jgi:hypothetical protein